MPFDEVIAAIAGLTSALSSFGLSESAFEVALFGLAGIVCGGLIIYAVIHNM